ncbi:MFS transporter [Fictibacillus fluitans]|uniref:MFS transporter n=1 Tax=Fictibacillus fluitans TaxID=3058422 RepID=A0ABT8I059_9BACL|nr:MFS transporter [Fictibacillus sp. NE201]MDN4526407.1 MFS transporter [Fictibacillus sp. NE201]
MWRIVLPGIAMIGVTYAFARFSFGLFLPNISQSINLTESNAGVTGSTAYIAYTLALFTSSYLIKRFGQLRVIQFAGLSAVIGLFGIGLSQNFLSLALSTFIAGLGSGWASPAYSQVASTSLNKDDKDRGNTWMNSGTSFGLIVSGPIAILFTDHWRFAFISFAIISLAVLLWNSIRIPYEKPELHDEKIISGPIFKKAKYLLLSSFIVGFGSSIYWTFSRSFLKVEYNMSDHESVIFWVTMGVTGAVGGLAGGIMNRGGLTLSYRLALLLLSISVISITIPSLYSVYSSGFLFGISYIFVTGLLIVWATRIFPLVPHVGVSLSFLALGVGQSIGSAMAGKLISMSSYSWVFIIYSFFCIIGLIIPVERKSF